MKKKVKKITKKKDPQEKILSEINETVKKHSEEQKNALKNLSGTVIHFEPEETPKKPAKLKGFVQTGMLFIGDPGYMVGSSNILPGDENPFRNWDKFTKEVGSYDYDLPFPDAFSDDASGRGVIVQLPIPSGKFEVLKQVDQEGNLVGFMIKFRE